MSSSHRKIQFGEKEYLKKLQEKAIEEFKKSDNGMLRIYPVSQVPAQTISMTSDYYEKDIQSMGNGKGRIFIIKKNNEPVSFIWETNAENIKKAVSYGAFNPEALTGKVIHAIGGYKAQVLERAYEKGIVSNKYQAKNELAAFWQKRVELLQPLEGLVNSDQSLEEVKKAIGNYIQQIQDYKHGLQQSEEKSALKKYDADIQEKFVNFLEDDIREMEFLSHELTANTLKSFLTPFGTASLMTSLRLQMIKMAKQAQGINQNVTHARTQFLPDSLLRGEFNGICEDVMRVINNYEPDLHNPVLAEHQGDFSSGKKRYLEFPSTHNKALAAICQIEGMDEIESITDENNNTKYVMKHKREKHLLQETRFASWWLGSASSQSAGGVKRGFFFFCNVVSGILLTLPDVAWGLVIGLVGLNLGSLVQAVHLHIEKKLPSTFYSKIIKRMQVPATPVAFLIAFSLGKSIHNFTRDLVRGIGSMVAQLTIKLPAVIEEDYYVGGWGEEKDKTQREQVFIQFDKDIQKIKEAQRGTENFYKIKNLPASLLLGRTSLENFREETAENNGIESQTVPDQYSEIDKKEERQFACPPYHLSPGEWEDIFSVFPRGLKSFAETILYPVHVKNPFIGLIYNLFYFGSGFTVLAPDKMPFPQVYKDFSHWLGAQLTHSPLNQAMASSATQGQGVALVFDGLFRGPQSMFGQMCNTLEEGIVDVAVLLFLAYGFGSALEKTPGIGYIIHAEKGNTEYITLATVGAKFTVLLHELFEKRKTGPVDHPELYQSTAEQFGQLLQKFQKELKSLPEDNPLKETLNKIIFLRKLTANADLLPHLPGLTQREMLQVAEQLFKETPEMMAAIKNMFHPYKPRSIAGRTFNIVGGYIINVLRIVISPFTGNLKQPCEDLMANVRKDLVRVVRGLHGMARFGVIVLYAALYTPLRAVADIIFNSILARLEGWIRGNRHSISRGTTKASESISQSYCQMAELLTPTDLYESVVPPPPVKVIREYQFNAKEIPKSLNQGLWSVSENSTSGHTPGQGTSSAAFSKTVRTH